MAEYRLYAVGESGNAYRVALMLELCGADWEPRFVDFFGGETRTEKYRREINEMGEVPVLEHQGRFLSQSGVILTWLSERLGRFAGGDADERLEVLRWILFDNHKLSSYLGTLRRMVGLESRAESDLTAFLRERSQASLAIVDRHMAGRQFVVGSNPTIADLSMVAYLYYPEHTGIDLASYPNLSAWTARVADLPGWKHPYDLLQRGLTPR